MLDVQSSPNASLHKIFIQRRREIALSEAAGDGHHALALQIELSDGLDRRANIRPRADAGKDAFLCKLSPPLERLIIGYRDHTIQQAGVEILRNEAGADSLDFVRTGLATADYR